MFKKRETALIWLTWWQAFSASHANPTIATPTSINSVSGCYLHCYCYIPYNPYLRGHLCALHGVPRIGKHTWACRPAGVHRIPPAQRAVDVEQQPQLGAGLTVQSTTVSFSNCILGWKFLWPCVARALFLWWIPLYVASFQPKSFQCGPNGDHVELIQVEMNVTRTCSHSGGGV